MNPKPCPCGYTHINVISIAYRNKYWISDCAKCGRVGTVAMYKDSRVAAVQEWNNRVEEVNNG